MVFLATLIVAQGESAPKARRKRVVDGKQVNIPALTIIAMEGRKMGSAALVVRV